MQSKERFLLWLLAGIIASQVLFLAYGAHFCASQGGLEACPDFGRRWENTYGVAIATVLALLTGSAFSSRPSSGGPGDASASSLPGPSQLPTPKGSSETQRQASRKPAQDLGQTSEQPGKKT